MATEDDIADLGLEVAYQTERLTLLATKGVFVHVYTKAPNIEDLDAIEAVARRVAHPYATVAVIAALGVARLEKDARERATQLAATTADWVGINISILMVTGFLAASVRGIIAAVGFFQRSDAKSLVTTSLDEATEFAEAERAVLAAPPPPGSFTVIVHRALRVAGVDLPQV